MTKEEKIIATAFTGKMFIDGSDMGLLYEYMEKKVGHGVIDLMLADKKFWEELHKACEQDFINMVSKEQPSLSSNLDETAEKKYPVYWKDYPKDGIARSELAYDTNKQCRDAFIAGAEWQYQKDRGEFAKIKAKTWCEGFDAHKNQMLKDAVEAEVLYFGETQDVSRTIKIPQMQEWLKPFKDGDKVRIVILKEEEE